MRSKRPAPLRRNLVERPWGGEIWFTADEQLPLLFKFIFTREALSFQVHPDDDYAAAHHQSRGKSEMWYIVSAAPGARIGLGFREAVTGDRLTDAAASGEIEHLVNWIAPKPGDAFYTPAGTVHAIGGGIELWEVQENSDITYRLFDYGRGRELHLEHALNVTNTQPSDASPVALPICCPWFCTEKLAFAGALDYPHGAEKWSALIVVSGAGHIDGEPFEQGQVWLVPSGTATLHLRADQPVELLRSYVP